MEVCLQPRNSQFIDAALSVAVVRNWEGRQLPCAGCVISPSASGWGNAVWANAELKRIAERKRQQEQLRLFQSVVLNTKDAVLITEAEPTTGPGRRVLYSNNAFTQITGYTLEEVVGRQHNSQGPKPTLIKSPKSAQHSRTGSRLRLR